MLTQSELKRLLHYSQCTGVFTWLVSRSNRVKIGDVAGCPNKAGYLRIVIDGKHYRSQRLAWLYVYGEFPDHFIDHINGIRDDNRLVNLRDVTVQENSKNLGMRSDNSSGFNGVSWYKRFNKWESYIHAKGKKIRLGLFINKEDAIEARQVANIKYKFHENHGRT